MPDDPNKAALKYLDYYCDPKRSFPYAVMLRAPWGAGKTHLIKKYLQQRTEKGHTKNLYISLYGITSSRQIDEAIFGQLHPILARKDVKLLYRVGKGLLKGVVKIDLDGDGKEDLTLNAGLPDIDFADFSAIPSECLLVFDDLERCSMRVSDVLGYINSFVEHDGYKAIVIANEDAIHKRKDDNYAEIKEKLIGQTLTVRSNADVALKEFLNGLRNKRARRYIIRRIDDLRLLHEQSQTDNLRLLQHALLDFERLSAALNKEHWSNETGLGILFRNVISLSYEVRSGRLQEDQIRLIRTGLRIFRKEGEEDDITDLLERRYPETEFLQTLLSRETLRRLLFDGWVASKDVQRDLSQSTYYASPTSLPPWKAAWHGWDLTDADFEAAVSKVEAQFKDRYFVSPDDDLFQVFGLRLWFANVGVIGLSRSDIVRECKEYIDDLKYRGTFPDPFKTGRRETFFSSHGLGVYENDSDELKDIIDYFYRTANQIAQERLPTKGRELLELMKVDAQEYFRSLCVNNVKDSPFFDIPVLASVDPAEFVDAVINLPPNSQNSVFSTFKGRYERNSLNGTLAAERPWLEQIVKEFEMRMQGMRPLSQYRLSKRIGQNITPLLNTER